MHMEGIRAVITGGLSGLGAATIQAIEATGGRLVVLDRGSPGSAPFTFGDSIHFIETDVASSSDVKLAIDEAVELLGGIDLCVCCAGIADAARVVGRDGTLYPLEVYRRVIDVNLVGLFDVVRRCAGSMAANEPNSVGERGVIVTVASIAGIEGQAGQAGYSASKAGVIGMTLPLARDLSSLGIRVVTICPGSFSTAMLDATSETVRDRLVAAQVFPKRLGDPAEFAMLVRSIVENPMLNGEVIRLDAALRLTHG